MSVARSNIGMVMYDNVMYALGGTNGQSIETVEMYQQGSWMPAPLQLAQILPNAHTAVSIDTNCA